MSSKMYTAYDEESAKELMARQSYATKDEVENTKVIPIEILQKITELLKPYVGVDSSGDIRADVIVVDRRFFSPMHFGAMLYGHIIDHSNEEECEDQERTATTNMKIAAEELGKVIDSRHWHNKRKREEKKE